MKVRFDYTHILKHPGAGLGAIVGFESGSAMLIVSLLVFSFTVELTW